jgi:hypothetical protein
MPPSLSTQPDAGLFSARFALLAAMLYNPFILIGYLVYAYGPTTCVAGPLCHFDTFPGALQVLLILAGCALLWLLLYVVVERALEASHARQNRYERVLSSMSDYPTMRPLLAGYGAALALALLIALYTRHSTAPAAVVGAFTAIVSLSGALAGRRPRAAPRPHPPRPAAPIPPTGQAARTGQTGQVASWPTSPAAEGRP